MQKCCLDGNPTYKGSNLFLSFSFSSEVVDKKNDYYPRIFCLLIKTWAVVSSNLVASCLHTHTQPKKH